jgi:hypothetical protein
MQANYHRKTEAIKIEASASSEAFQKLHRKSREMGAVQSVYMLAPAIPWSLNPVSRTPFIQGIAKSKTGMDVQIRSSMRKQKETGKGGGQNM